MRATASLAIVVTLLAAAAPARAQSWEASAFFGLTPAAGIERQASELDDVAVRGDVTWGVQGARFFSPAWGVEIMWTRQNSGLELETGDGKADLFSMNVRQLHFNGIYNLGRRADAKWQPFVFGGLGVTFFSADTVESETKFSLDVGGGVKFFPWRSIGGRAHFRYKPTFLNDSSSADFCDPFGFCQGTLNQLEFAGGVVVRF
jgi:opacity protein-like surface antigen